MFEQIDALQAMASSAAFVSAAELDTLFLKPRLAYLMTDQPDRAHWGLSRCLANPHRDDLVQACLACAWGLLIDAYAPELPAVKDPAIRVRPSKGQMKRSKVKHV